MRAVLALLFAGAFVCALAASPQNAFFPWHLTGDDFVAHIAGQPDVSKWEQQPQASYDQRYAEGYQAGVVDATQGKLWCAPPRMKPDEVNDRIWAELRKRQGTMHGSAAQTLIELYAARFPCKR